MRMRGGWGTARTGLLLLWQIAWPFLLYDVAAQLLFLFAGALLGKVGAMLLAAVATVAILFYFYGKRKERYRVHAGRSFKVRMGMAGSVLMLLIMAVSSALFFNLLVELSGIAELSASYKETEKILFGVSLWLQILFMVFAAPLVEELIFRGMCYERLRNGMGIAPAVVLSAGLFGLFHGNLVQGIYGFALGVIAALIYEHFDGLFYSILFHAGANLASILLTLLAGAFPSVFDRLPVKLILLVISGGVLALELRRLYSWRRRMTK